MQSDSPCVRIVDDDQAIRKLLTILVESWGYSSRAYASAEHFMSEDRLSDPGCVLVDLEMPGASGAELVGWLIQQPDPLPAIVVTGSGSVRSAVQCLKTGATEFLEKPIDRKALLDQIRGSVALDASQRILRQRMAVLRQYYASLSPREQQVIQYLAEGLSTKQIAGKLGLASKTVEHLRGRVMTKMHAESLADVVRAVVELGR